MQITWHGLSCVRLQSKDITVMVDPLPSNLGLQAPRLQADLFIFTETKNPQYAKAMKTDTFVIAQPGEYEVGGISIHGVPIEAAGSAITVYTMQAEGMVVGHLGALGETINGPQIELLKDIDVLFLPVGGKPTLSAKQATEILSVLEPRVVIPLYYKVPGLTMKLEGVEVFLKELGVKSTPPQEKIRLVRKELPEEDMQVQLLKIS